LLIAIYVFLLGSGSGKQAFYRMEVADCFYRSGLPVGLTERQIGCYTLCELALRPNERSWGRRFPFYQESFESAIQVRQR
jgi:hypothetical protein